MQQDAISAFRKNLNDLEEIVMQAKRVPLSNMCMVDRERILGLANAITTDLPTVFAECEGRGAESDHHHFRGPTSARSRPSRTPPCAPIST